MKNKSSYNNEYTKLIDTNPVAYKELIRFCSTEGPGVYTKETLPSHTKYYLAEWQCPSGKHTWHSTIGYREFQETDPGCPICKNNADNANPKLFATRIFPGVHRNWVEALIYCKDCFLLYWKKDSADNYDFSFHADQCYEGRITFAERFPEAVEEWSEKNIIPVDRILYDPELDYKFIWNCKTCKLEYKRTMKQYVHGRKTTACPYCRGTLPKPQESLSFLYPQIAAEFNYEMNNKGYRYDFEEKITPYDIFPSNKNRAFFTCDKCGLTDNYPVKDYIDYGCKYCRMSLFTMYKDLIDKEWKYQNNVLLVNPRHIFPNSKINVWWTCSKCNKSYLCKIKKRILAYNRNKNLCPNCKGRRRIKYRN